MAKTIVTHVNPDLDAIAAAWLLVRYGGSDFHKASFAFVPAGCRFQNEDNNVVHVDTGLGKFDHHQEDRGQEDTCAAKLVFEWLVEKKDIGDQEALQRLVSLVNDSDHFREYFWPESSDDRYVFFLDQVLNGMKQGGIVDDEGLMIFGMQCLDGILTAMKMKIAAEKVLEEGISFQTKWGKAVGFNSSHSGAGKYALKKGYKVAVRKDPNNQMVRIKAAPLDEIDLTPVYRKLVKMDPEATWYFHPSKHMILNGSLRNPEMKASKLSLDEVMRVLKEK